MANRDYKNIKRFVDNLSKEVEDVMENGGGSGTGEMYAVQVNYDETYPSNFVTFVDTQGLASLNDLINYLKKKGYTSKDKFYPVSGLCGAYPDNAAYTKGIFVGKDSYSGEIDEIKVLSYENEYADGTVGEDGLSIAYFQPNNTESESEPEVAPLNP